MSTTDDSTFTVDSAIHQLSYATAASTQSTGLWQTAILAIGRRVAASVGNTDDLADDAIAALAESLDFDFCGVAEPLSNGGMSLTLNAVKLGVTVPTGQLSIPERPDDALMTLAVSSGRMVSTTDMSEETRYRDPILRRCQAQSAVACPLRSSGVNYGGILLAGLAPRSFLPAELVCVETISHLITAALARSRAERLLETSQISADVLEAVDAPVVVVDAESRLLRMNRSCEELTGFSLSDIERREFCSALVMAGEEATAKRNLDQILRDGQPRSFEARLQKKHGAQRRVEWRFRRLTANRGDLLVGAGIDVTAKCELEGRVAKLQNAFKTSNQPATPAAADASREAPKSGDGGDAGDGANRRRFPRRAYPYVQRMAPVRNNQMPRLDEFFDVECRDISAGGFSYYAATKPIETDVMIAFGASGMETFLTARIMHARPALRNGKSMFAVGCKYTGRSKYGK